MMIKHEPPYEDAQPAKRVKLPQDGSRTQSHRLLKKSDYDSGSDNNSNDSDSGDTDRADSPIAGDANALPVALSAAANAFAAQLLSLAKPIPNSIPGTLNASGVDHIIKKMARVIDREARISHCDRELERIAIEIAALEMRTFVSEHHDNSSIARAFRLGEERQAIMAIRDKTTRKLAAAKRRAEKDRRAKLETKRQLEAKRLSTRLEVKNQAGKKVPQVDLTNDTRVVVKLNPNASAASLRAFKKLEENYIIKQEEDSDQGVQTVVKMEEE